jgi:hypothetical protein
MFLDHFSQMAGGQHDAPDLLRREPAHDPFQKRTAIHGRHGLGQIAEQMLDARAKTARKNHGSRLVRGNHTFE